jgi:hypothetical protein
MHFSPHGWEFDYTIIYRLIFLSYYDIHFMCKFDVLSNKYIQINKFYKLVWSEFLATEPEVPGSIYGAIRWSEK